MQGNAGPPENNLRTESDSKGKAQGLLFGPASTRNVLGLLAFP